MSRRFVGAASVMPASHCDVRLTADNRLYALILCGFIEVDDTVHDPVVCNGYCRHIVIQCRFDYFIYLGCSIKQAITCMKMKMNKWLSVFHITDVMNLRAN